MCLIRIIQNTGTAYCGFYGTSTTKVLQEGVAEADELTLLPSCDTVSVGAVVWRAQLLGYATPPSRVELGDQLSVSPKGAFWVAPEPHPLHGFDRRKIGRSGDLEAVTEVETPTGAQVASDVPHHLSGDGEIAVGRTASGGDHRLLDLFGLANPIVPLHWVHHFATV